MPESNDPDNMASEKDKGKRCRTKTGKISCEWEILKQAIRESAEKTVKNTGT